MLSQKLQDDLMSAYQQVHEAKRGHAAGDSDVEKQASQLASDVRYKAKGKVKDGASEEEKKKIFMQILGASPASSAVKAMARTKLLGEEVEVKEGSAYGITKGDGMSFPERLKKKAKEKKKKMKMEEEKKELPTTKMYRKAGNLSRKALSKGLDSKEGSKAQKRSEKIVSTISTADEKKRFDNMKTKKSELYNDTTGKFRKEWEALKLIETENYREQFDKWLDGIVEEGYDIERWSDEELVDTFINENNLWASREAVDSALLESDKKGKGSGKKDACYHKVKASASVWPSAYASGRLVQCRKKGAANYGKGKK